MTVKSNYAITIATLRSFPRLEQVTENFYEVVVVVVVVVLVHCAVCTCCDWSK